MIFPIGDDQVQGGYKPIFSYTFIVLNVLFFLFQLSNPGSLICELGTIPRDIVNGENYYTLLSSMFMHGGWMHLIGNMMFLWVFADNIEATIGNIPFLVFYLLGGLAASMAHIYFGYGEEVAGMCCLPCGDISCAGETIICAGAVPSVGASGAIAAVLGAYLVMFPKSKIKMLVVYFFRSFKIPAFLFLGFWIGQQFLNGYLSIGELGSSGGTAWWAHIGGFVFGIVAGLFGRQTMNINRNNDYV